MNDLGRIERIERALEAYIANCSAPEKLKQSMAYSLLAGGKRLRPSLCLQAAEMLGGSEADAMPVACALEMIHTYSLVHDDLPAMDNDEYRRGRKTTHVVYGEAMAILAGDGLLNYAFETAMKSFTMEGDLEKKARALSVLAQKAGIYGMIGGQTADIEAEDLGDQVTTEHLMFIHAHKTSALIEAAMMTGAILAGASQEEIAQIEKAAYEIGIAFQIQDDILDVTSTLEMLGKPIGSDAKNHKTTYVTLKGLEESRKEQQELSLHAIETIRNIGYSNDFLMELVTSLITREK